MARFIICLGTHGILKLGKKTLLGKGYNSKFVI